jgi:hypothetical protein
MYKIHRSRFIILTLSLILSLVLPVWAAADTKQDFKGHWAEQNITLGLEKGYITGYTDGSFKPDQTITRAEFFTLVNKSFDFKETTEIDFTDVSSSEWFYPEVAKAKLAGYIKGYEDGSIRPNQSISRQEAAVILTSLLKLDVALNQSATSQFTDAAQIPQWSKGAINAVAAKSIMGGYPDKSYQAAKSITRAEALVTIDRSLVLSKATTYDQAGTYGNASERTVIDGDVFVEVAGITLENMTIKGNLVLAAGIGEGNVYLNNVLVEGDTTILGGGEHSIYVKNSTLAAVTINKKDVRVVAQGTTSAGSISVQSGAKLVTDNLSGNGFGSITIEESVPAEAKVSFSGDFGSVEVKATRIQLSVEQGSVKQLSVAASAKESSIQLAEQVKVTTLTLNAATQVTGKGTIETAKINVDGTVFEQTPASVETASGVTTTIDGQETTSSTSGGSSSGGSSDTTAPTVSGAAIIVGGQEVPVELNDNTGTVNLSNIAIYPDLKYITKLNLTVSEASTLTFSERSTNLDQGSNQLEIFSDLDPQGDGVSLGRLRELFGDSFSITGTLVDSVGNESSFTVEIIISTTEL